MYIHKYMYVCLSVDVIMYQAIAKRLLCDHVM